MSYTFNINPIKKQSLHLYCPVTFTQAGRRKLLLTGRSFFHWFKSQSNKQWEYKSKLWQPAQMSRNQPMMMPHHFGVGGWGVGGGGAVQGVGRFTKGWQFRKYFPDKAETHTQIVGWTDTVIPVYPANFVTGSTKRLLTSMRCDGNSLKWAMADTCWQYCGYSFSLKHTHTHTHTVTQVIQLV